MTREFLQAAPAAPKAPSTLQPVRPAAPVAAEAAAPPPALAGALPPWDLLPGTPFVRRVK